jgi:hypothetical protein
MKIPILMEAMGTLAEIHGYQHETLGELLLVDRGDFRLRLVPELGYMIEYGERTWPVTYREAYFAVGGDAGARQVFARLARELRGEGSSVGQLRTWCAWCAEGAKAGR